MEHTTVPNLYKHLAITSTKKKKKRNSDLLKEPSHEAGDIVQIHSVRPPQFPPISLSPDQNTPKRPELHDSQADKPPRVSFSGKAMS